MDSGYNSYSNYTGEIARKISDIFGVQGGYKSARLVELRTKPGTSSITAHGDNYFVEVVISESGAITLAETDITRRRYQVTMLNSKGTLQTFSQAFSHERGVVGTLKSEPISDPVATAAKLEGIAIGLINILKRAPAPSVA